jgi:metal-responsive CopG/Arc/MetJ family transcriptional regulator
MDMNANAKRQRRHVERLAEQGKRRILVVLPDHQIERLDAIAKDRGISRSSLIGEAIDGALGATV